MTLPARQPDVWREPPFPWKVVLVVGIFAGLVFIGLYKLAEEGGRRQLAEHRAALAQAADDAKRCEASGRFPILSADRTRLERCER